MTATNHAATGAVLALAIQNPFVALPAAFLSHFILDILPHQGLPFDKRPIKQTISRDNVIDLVMLPITVFMLLIVAGASWAFVAIAMFVSVSPDFVWTYRYFREKKGEVEARNRFTHWHSRIQWAERNWGWIIEIAWFTFIIVIVLQSVVLPKV